MRTFADFDVALRNAKIMLDTYGEEVNPGRWQGVPTEGRPDLTTVEIMDWHVSVPVQQGHKVMALDDLREQIKPNLPWADDHFEERVSRVPSNPGEEYKNWPWWHPTKELKTVAVHEDLGETFTFTHTYQERFWPKRAYHWRNVEAGIKIKPQRGIRYEYGDLDDVVSMLLEEPYTRQATFPIFFPEDTGALHGGRIPCTLHYHFLLRNNKLHMWYPIRSCDYVRHLRDDLYMACRLMLWVLDELQTRTKAEKSYDETLWMDVDPGYLHFTAYSLHYHKGDSHLVN